MAHAAKKYFDLDILRTRLAPPNAERSQPDVGPPRANASAAKAFGFPKLFLSLSVELLHSFLFPPNLIYTSIGGAGRPCLSDQNAPAYQQKHAADGAQ